MLYALLFDDGGRCTSMVTVQAVIRFGRTRNCRELDDDFYELSKGGLECFTTRSKEDNCMGARFLFLYACAFQKASTFVLD